MIQLEPSCSQVARRTLSDLNGEAAYKVALFSSAFIPYPPCLLYTSPSPRDRQKSRMPSSA